MDTETTLSELQLKVSSLTEDIKVLKFKLRNKKKENQMLREARLNLNNKWNDIIEHTRRQNKEQIKILMKELEKKEDELTQMKELLARKEKELSEKIKELEMKSALVVQLQNELEEMRRNFCNQREEMDQILIVSKALAHSNEKYLEELGVS